MGIFDIVKNAISPVTDIINKAVTDKDKAKQLTYEIKSQLLDKLTTQINAQRDVIIAEAQGESWIQRNWRPVLMISFTAIVVNNYILSPYLGAMFNFSVQLDVPSQMWDLLKLGIGGYIVGRSGEKIAKHLKK